MTQPLLQSDGADGSVGRNAPCPCGSGKKYKRCHGKVEKPKASLPKGSAEGRRGSLEAVGEQLKAAGMDLSQVDPAAIMGMQKALARLPRGQMMRLQRLMQKAMSGKDVSREAKELERMLPSGLMQQMQALSGGMAGILEPGVPGLEEEPMSADEAREIVQKAATEGKLTSGQAEALLGRPADGEGVKASKGFWKKLTGR